MTKLNLCFKFLTYYLHHLCIVSTKVFWANGMQAQKCSDDPAAFCDQDHQILKRWCKLQSPEVLISNWIHFFLLACSPNSLPRVSVNLLKGQYNPRPWAPGKCYWMADGERWSFWGWGLPTPSFKLYRCGKNSKTLQNGKNTSQQKRQICKIKTWAVTETFSGSLLWKDPSSAATEKPRRPLTRRRSSVFALRCVCLCFLSFTSGQFSQKCNTAVRAPHYK